MALGGKFAMILIATIKVPFLFLVTLAIVCPPVYISNLFVGARHSALQIAAMLLSSVAVTSTVLASMATVALFFALTSRTYDFIKLLHVLFFVYAGWAGLRMFLTCVEGMGRGGAATTPLRVLAIWLLLYAFVGTQMAWVLRPYVGTPNMPATLFREEARRGNFYESVWRSLGNFVRGEGR
jgi:hypothetical protein